MEVIKRDGTKVVFDSSKIRSAISKANTRSREMSDEDIDKIVEVVAAKCDKLGIVGVETIQDLVERTLQTSKFKSTAKQYILYRDQRTRIRNGKMQMMKEFADKLLKHNTEYQNANLDANSFGGRKGEAANVLMKQFALDTCMSKLAREAHLNNEIYTHDLDSYAAGMHNCLSIPYDMLLEKGFNTRQTDIRPAGSVSTAFQLVAVIAQIQSLQQFGGVSATHLDWTMVPYVRKSFAKHYKDGLEFISNIIEIDYEISNMLINCKDVSIDDLEWKAYNEQAYNYAIKMTERELKQSVEAMYHNLNSLQSRSGNQLPFTSVNFGTCTSTEGRMVTRALLNGCLAGVGKHHRTSIFPCGIFQYKKGVNDKPGTPNYDLFRLALECTAKRLYPNYANCDWSGNAGYDPNDPKTYFSTMGKCKLQLI